MSFENDMEIRIKWKKSTGILAVSGLLLCLFGVLLGTIIFPSIIEMKIKEETALSNNSEAFKHWLQPPPLLFNVYIFNVTNPTEVAAGEKPIVREVGPYVYVQRMIREVIDYHEEDDTLSYATRKIYTFNQQRSGSLKESDKVTMINPTLMGIVLTVYKLLPMALPIVNDAIPSMFPDRIPGTVFSTFTVKELLFSGVPINCSNTASDLVCKNLKMHQPTTVTQLPDSPDSIFSFFNHKNNSLEGPYRIYRGRKIPTNVGKIKMYKNQDTLKVWPVNTSCNIIQGTDSTIFPPFMKKSELLYIFVPDVCRSMFAEFKRVIKFDNVISYEYVGSTKNFADPSRHPDNICHCENGKQTSSAAEPSLVCPKEGAIFLSKCYRSPVHFSQPHFYGAHKDYTDYVVGLHPNSRKHQTYVQIEPRTGVPIKGFRRLQINIELRFFKEINILETSSTGLFNL
ncbi:sensory neuron membrane protein 2-like [Nilaparvata lugens]|uniref:sensory neuron membrane protein 2-like n=1 Tax=Nilaparvata lugens TaxID=108931 RepID=UPI00193CABFB|nr:sensory neuron membrane protein 2-like [Nilaparvata lugens]